MEGRSEVQGVPTWDKPSTTSCPKLDHDVATTVDAALICLQIHTHACTDAHTHAQTHSRTLTTMYRNFCISLFVHKGRITSGPNWHYNITIHI